MAKTSTDTQNTSSRIMELLNSFRSELELKIRKCDDLKPDPKTDHGQQLQRDAFATGSGIGPNEAKNKQYHNAMKAHQYDKISSYEIKIGAIDEAIENVGKDTKHLDKDENMSKLVSALNTTREGSALLKIGSLFKKTLNLLPGNDFVNKYNKIAEDKIAEDNIPLPGSEITDAYL